MHSERIIAKAVVMHAEELADFLSIDIFDLRKEVMLDKPASLIIEAAKELRRNNKEVDAASIIETLTRHTGERTALETVHLILETEGEIKTLERVREATKGVVEAYYIRTYQGVAGNMAKALSEVKTIEEADDLRAGFIDDLLSVRDFTTTRVLDFEATYKLMRENMRKGTQARDGADWGIGTLNALTSGIEAGKVYVVGATKKSGKTRFAISVMKSILAEKTPVAMLSLEIGEYDITKLIVSAYSGVNDMLLRSEKHLSYIDISALDSIKAPSDLFTVDCSSALTGEDVVNKVIKYAYRGAKVIIIDYFQRIVLQKSDYIREMAEVANKIADAARRYKIAVIMLAQLNVVGETEEPDVRHIKYGGGLAEAADVIIILENLKRRFQLDDWDKRFYLHVTQRYGEPARNVKVHADLGVCRFQDWQDAPEAAYTKFDPFQQKKEDEFKKGRTKR